MPPGFLPVPPRWGITLPSLLMSCIFLVFELSQGWQCLLEVRSMPNWHRIGTNCVRTNPPIVSVHTNFFWQWCGACGLRPPICPSHDTFLHCDPSRSCSYGTSRLGWTGRGYPSRTYSCISSWASSRRSTHDSPWLLPVTVPVGSPFLYVVIRNREEIHGVLDEFLVLLCSVSQEVPARAVDDADVPVWQTYFALCFGLHIE